MISLAKSSSQGNSLSIFLLSDYFSLQLAGNFAVSHARIPTLDPDCRQKLSERKIQESEIPLLEDLARDESQNSPREAFIKKKPLFTWG